VTEDFVVDVLRRKRYGSS